MAVAWATVAVGVAPLSWARGAHAEQPRLEVRTPAVRPGEDIAVVHSVLPVVDTHAWIGFYEKAADRDENYLRYTFLANLTDRVYDVPAPQKIGTEYHFRLFLTKGYVCAARSSPVEVSLTPRVRLPPAPSPTQAPPSQPIPEPPPRAPPDVQPGGAPVVPEDPPPSASGDSMRVTITDWVRVDLPPSSGPQTVSAGEGLRVTFPASALARGARASIGRVTHAPTTVFGIFGHLGMYEVGLEGRKEYDEDVVLEWRFDPAELDTELPPEDQLIAARWDAKEKVWVELPSTIHPDRGLVVARTRHLSIIAAIRRLKRAGIRTLFTINTAVPKGLKRLTKRARWTSNFELLYSVTDLHGTGNASFPNHVSTNVIAAWPGEPRDEEFGYLWDYQHPEWIPFIRDIAYYLEKSLAEYQKAGSNSNVQCFKPSSSMTTFEIGSGAAGGVRGGAFDYLIGQGYLSTDADSVKGGWAQRDHFKHNAAHELFHAIQHNKVIGDPAKAVEPEAVWWMESNAEYAAAFVAWPGNTALAQRDVYRFLLSEPITTSGPFVGVQIEYAKGYFIDQLVRNGANFVKIHKEVMEGLALTGDALTPLETHLSRHSPKGLPGHFRDFAVHLYLSDASPLTAPYLEPGQVATVEQVGKARHSVRLSLKDAYTAKLWTGILGTPEPPGQLLVTAESLPASARVELFLQNGHGWIANPQPVAVMTKEGDTALISVSGVTDPDPQVLYALAMNFHNKKPAEVSIAVEQAPQVGFWVLDESERKPPGDRPGYTTVKLGEHEYESKVDIKRESHTYKAAGWVRWDTLPKVVPNGTDWRMPIRARFDGKLTRQDPDAAIIRLPVDNESAGFSVKMESCGTIYRPRSVEEKQGLFAAFIAGTWQHPSEKSGFSWYTFTRHNTEIEDAVSLAFPLLSPKVTNTPERPTITLSAWVADQRITEKHAYRWSHELPKELEADLRREVGRANFLGARSWTKDMAAGAQASTVTLEAPASLAEGTTAVLSSLKHLPPLLQAGQEAAFEVDLKDGPATPMFSWYFGVGPPSQANAWTEARQTRFTYMNPGVYTVRVTVRDKTAYTRGLLAEGAWRVSVAPAAEEEEVTRPASD